MKGPPVARAFSRRRPTRYARRPSRCRRALLFVANEQLAPVLLRRGRREHLALAARLGFRLGLGRLLGFFLAFVFASHASHHDTKRRPAKRANCSELLPAWLTSSPRVKTGVPGGRGSGSR